MGGCSRWEHGNVAEFRSRGYFIDPNATHRISLKGYDGSDHWVDIRDELPEVDYRRLQDVMINIVNTTDRNRPDESRSTTLIDSARHFAELFKGTIREWSLTEVMGPDGIPLLAGETNPATGQPTPAMEISLMSIRRITGVGAWIAAQIDKHYRESRMSETDRKNSFALLGSGISEPAAHPQNGRSGSESANSWESHTIEGTSYPIQS